MEFDKQTQRILLSLDERTALERQDLFGGIPVEGLPLLQARVAGLMAINEFAEQYTAGKSSVERFEIRRIRNTLQQMQSAFPQIQQSVWGELFEEPPIRYDMLD
jgi:hypothetical protein